MRSSLVVASLFIAGTAAADPEIIIGPSDTAPVDRGHQRAAFVFQSPAQTSGMWLDFGAGVDRVVAGNGNVYNGQFVRFAPLTTIQRHFYIGAEIDVGSFDGTPIPTDSASRGTMTGGGSTMTADAQAGTLCAAKAVAGARAMAGIFSGGVELASGIQYTELTTTAGTNNVGHGVIEARGRLDLWFSPHVSIGGMVGTDLTEKNNMTAGLQLGFHFEPYDHSR
ncbi:MAG TPA: hypothetical protein VF403_24780 [Kofleriaceae bacterium]